MPWFYINSTNELAALVADRVAAQVRKEFRVKGDAIVASVEELEAAINGQWEVLAPAVSDIQTKIRTMSEELANGATSERLAELLSDVNASTSQIAQGLANAMQDSNTPDPSVPAPSPENPLPTDNGTPLENQSEA